MITFNILNFNISSNYKIHDIVYNCIQHNESYYLSDTIFNMGGTISLNI